MNTLPYITTSKLEADLEAVQAIGYENMHPRWSRAFADLEHALRVLIAFREADDSKKGQAGEVRE